MSLAHAILGLLQQEPMTGYDLKTRCFDASIAHFWPADQAQIYRTLDRLAEQGFVESELEYQAERPNRKVYQLTGGGRAELRRWLTTPLSLPAYREPFLIQLFFAEELPNEQILSQLQAQRDMYRERLAGYEAIPLPPIGHPDATRDLTLQRLTLELGIRIQQATIEWLEMAMSVVEKL